MPSSISSLRKAASVVVAIAAFGSMTGGAAGLASVMSREAAMGRSSQGALAGVFVQIFLARADPDGTPPQDPTIVR